MSTFNYESTENKNQYLIGLDLGTTAIKGVLMSVDGTIASRGNKKMEYERLDKVVVQFDGEHFFEIVADLINDLVGQLPIGTSVIGLSMASASGNTMLIDNTDKPLIPAISWMDQRVVDEVEKVLGEYEVNNVHQIAGWPFNRMFPLSHLSWLKYHKPALLQQTHRVCMTTDYVNYMLTGNWGIDPSTATTFYLQDQVNENWYLPYLKQLGIPTSKLPPILPSGTVLGTITEEAAKKTGLLQGTPVVLGAFDHPCAARGSGVFHEGQMLISCGTSWVGFYPVKNRQIAIQQNMLIDPFLNPNGEWGAMFSLAAIGESVDKLVRRYISDEADRYIEFDRLSAMARSGANGLFINPLSVQPIPNIDKFAKEDIARAIMEGTVYLLKVKADNLCEVGINATSAVMVGGPSETYPWPQILSDIMGMQLSVINGSCAGAVGAAVLAGIGVGIFENEKDAFNKLDFEEKTISPNQSLHMEYERLYQQFLRVQLN